MGRSTNPTVSLRAIAATLRRYRAAKEVTLETAANAVGYHAASLSRAEQAKSAPHPTIVKALLEYYGEADAAVVSDYVALAKHGRKRGWWNTYADLMQVAYLGLEGAARKISWLEIQLIPGLLQTDAYTRSLIEAESKSVTEEEIRRRLAVRAQRRAILSDPNDPCELCVVVDESVLHRVIGSPEVMADQLDHLITMSKQPNVTVQVVPFSAGEHGSLSTRFALLEFDDPTDPGVVYLEQLHWQEEFVEEPLAIKRFGNAFGRMQAIAEPPRRSVAMLKEVRKNLNNSIQ